MLRVICHISLLFECPKLWAPHWDCYDLYHCSHEISTILVIGLGRHESGIQDISYKHSIELPIEKFVSRKGYGFPLFSSHIFIRDSAGPAGLILHGSNQYRNITSQLNQTHVRKKRAEIPAG